MTCQYVCFGLLHPGRDHDAWKASIDAAIRRMEESRETHVKWIKHFDVCDYCREHPPQYIQSSEEHAVIVQEYDGVLKVLRSLVEL